MHGCELGARTSCQAPAQTGQGGPWPSAAREAIAEAALQRLAPVALRRLLPSQALQVRDMLAASGAVPLPGGHGSRRPSPPCHACRAHPRQVAQRARVALGLLGGLTDAEGHQIDRWTAKEWLENASLWFETGAQAHALDGAGAGELGARWPLLLGAMYLLAHEAAGADVAAQRQARDHCSAAARRLGQLCAERGVPPLAASPSPWAQAVEPDDPSAWAALRAALSDGGHLLGAAAGVAARVPGRVVDDLAGRSWAGASGRVAQGASPANVAQALYFLHRLHALLSLRQEDVDALNPVAREEWYLPIERWLQGRPAFCALADAAQRVLAGLGAVSVFTHRRRAPLGAWVRSLPACCQPYRDGPSRSWAAVQARLGAKAGALQPVHALADAIADHLIDPLAAATETPVFSPRHYGYLVNRMRAYGPAGGAAFGHPWCLNGQPRQTLLRLLRRLEAGTLQAQVRRFDAPIPADARPCIAAAATGE